MDEPIANQTDGSKHGEMPTGQLLLTPEQAAATLAICRTRIYELLRQGQLESVQIGTSRRIPYVALTEYVQRLRSDSSVDNPSRKSGPVSDRSRLRPQGSLQRRIGGDGKHSIPTDSEGNPDTTCATASTVSSAPRHFEPTTTPSRSVGKVEGEELAGLVTDPRGGERLFGEYADVWVEHRLVKGRPLTPATAQGLSGAPPPAPPPGLWRHQAQADHTRADPALARRDRGHFERSSGQGLPTSPGDPEHSVADELIGRNPCTIRGAGVEQARERPMLDTAAVLELADAMEPRLRCLVLLGGFAGMRSGELLGLQRRDIDPLHRTVTVERQAHELTGLGRVLTPPKSEAGRRTVALPLFVLHPQGPSAGLCGIGNQCVRLHPADRSPTAAPGSLSCVEGCLRVVGIEGVRPHDLRHHAATVIARNPSVTLRELMATIGHSSHVAALRYQHATAERSREIAEYLDGVISAARPPNRSPETTIVPPACGMGAAWSEPVPKPPSRKGSPQQDEQQEAAGGIEPPYGALQAPA